MTDALRDAWLAEMWAPVREVPREEREAEKARAESLWETYKATLPARPAQSPAVSSRTEPQKSLQTSPPNVIPQVNYGKMKGAPGGQTRCAAPPSAATARKAAP